MLEFLVEQGATDARALLERHPLPEGCEEIWQMFMELHAARQSTGHGPLAITYTEIHAWAALTGRSLAPEEVTLLRELDGAFLSHAAKLPNPEDDEDDDEDDDGSPA